MREKVCVQFIWQKKQWLKLLGAVLLAACSEHDEGWDDASSEGRVAFTALTEITTRAGGTYIEGTAFPAGATIGVYGFRTGTAPFGDGTAFKPDFMLDQPVTLDEATALWIYDPVKYWPNNYDEKVTFWGYYPHDGAGISITPQGSDTPQGYYPPAADNDSGIDPETAKGLPVVHFTVQPNSRDQVDLMTSDIVADENHRNADRTTSILYKVPLRFHHALTRVQFRVLNEVGDPIPFVARLWGVYDKGRCQTTTDGTSLQWTDLEQTAPAVTFTTEGATNETERAFLMIPQPLRGEGAADDPCVQLTYEYYGKNFDSEIIHLNAIRAVGQWEPGKVYTYVYLVSHSGTDISVSVSPWYQAGMVFNY